MKKLLFVLGIVAMANGVFAQDSSIKIQDSDLTRNSLVKKSCYLMKDGQMMVLKHGDTTSMKVMDKSVTLNNGSTVSTDGTVKLADGTTKMLKEGWYVDTDGKIGLFKDMVNKDRM